MPLFVSDAELEKAGGDVSVVVELADSYIRELLQQLETQKARADAAAISAEQNCTLIEQRYLSLSAQFMHVENDKVQLSAALERKSTELTQAEAQAHRLELECIKKDRDIEHLMLELSELRKSKRELLEIVEQRNSELNEKNASIRTYLDKIVALTDRQGAVEGKLNENEAEMVRLKTVQARLSQEKELLEQHNAWLNEELTSKVNSLLDERHANAELEMEFRSKLSEAERIGKDATESLQRGREQVKELEAKLNQTKEELRFTKDDAAAKEKHFEIEVATASRLADLYKQSSEEWSKKATELEGVIKALEVHLNQIESDWRKKLEEETNAREASEREAAESKEKLEKILIEAEASKTDRESDSLTLVKRSDDSSWWSINHELALELHGEGPIVPSLPLGISGTAFAAALLRDGWTITKIYIKYQEAVDAWRHERHERKNCQCLLERVLHEIEQKAEVIMDERAEHAQMVNAYSIMEEKLHLSMDKQDTLENSMMELRVELKRKERELKSTQKEISDLETQVAVLLKECADIKQQHVGGKIIPAGSALEFTYGGSETTPSDKLISDRLLTFKDIHGMVEHNSQLRALVRSLAEQNEQRERELKEIFDIELKKRTDEAVRKVAIVLKKSEEQSEIIESLQGTVGMYRRLYEEEHKLSYGLKKASQALPLPSGDSGNDFKSLMESSQNEIQKVREESSERLKCLEEELNKTKKEASDVRLERDRLIVEGAYAREQLQVIIKESENQRKEMDAVLARNMEFSQTITDYQRKLRENAQRVQNADEKSRRLSIEVSVLEREKELISSAEKRASQEVASLSNRVHRLQATLDNINTVEEARETVKAAEKRKLESEVNRMQREWADTKRELEMERTHGRRCIDERDQAVKQAMDRVDSISKELADVLHSASEAETKAHVAEARCRELEMSLKRADEKVLAVLNMGNKVIIEKDNGSDMDSEALLLLQQAKEEIEQLKEDLVSSKYHAEQYKKIAQANEDALKKLEDVHSQLKSETEKSREALESELASVRKQLEEMEGALSEKEKVAGSIAASKDKALDDAAKEIASLLESGASKQAALEQAEERVRVLKEEVDKLHQQWRSAQNNYERQVLLQADTIRELKIASEKLMGLEKDVVEFHGRADRAQAELDSSKTALEMEKASLLEEKNELEKQLKELEYQNKVLLDRLEDVTITIPEQELTADSGAERLDCAGHGGSDLQNVIQYLRRSKEMADTEMSLLKQERLRLQKQLETCLAATENAQAKLRREQENVRSSLCTEEEFRSLQAQVREMNLFQESNAQLREENKQLLEDCRELHEKALKAQKELENFQKAVRERDIELEGSAKENEVLKAEIHRWQTRVSQLLEKYKTVDMEDYEKAKSDLSEIQEELKTSQVELVAMKREMEISQEKLLKLDYESSLKDERIAELDKKLLEGLQSEASCKADIDKLKKQVSFLKRKIEILTKEKEDIIKERDAYSKQIEDLKVNAAKRSIPEALAQQEQAQKETENLLKEKETRIQSLERTLEREREELRKEKAKRQKDQKTFFEVAQKAAQEKQKFLEEMNNLKKERDHYIEQCQTTGIIVTESPVAVDIDERTSSYQVAVQEVSETALSIAPETQLQVPIVTTEPVMTSTSDVLPIFAPVDAFPISGEVSTGSATVPATVAAIVPPTFMPMSISMNRGPAATVPTSNYMPRPSVRSTSTAIAPPLSRPSLRLTVTNGIPLQGSESKENKEREIQNLRAMIQEKERDVRMQARKTGRKLIRPKIEPSNQQEIQAEPSDSAMESILEGTEGEAEPQEESKDVAIGGVEATEGVSVTTAIILAACPSNTTAELPVSSNQNSSLLAIMTGQRKRSLLSASSAQASLFEDALDHEVKGEALPPHKRVKGLDLKQLVGDPQDTTLPDCTITTESDKDDTIEAVETMPSAIEVLVKQESKSLMLEAGSPDISHTSGDGEIPKNNIGSFLSEAPASKRPRIIKSGSLTTSLQPQMAGERVEGITEERKGAQGAEFMHPGNTAGKSTEYRETQDSNEAGKSECIDAYSQRSANEILAPSGQEAVTHLDTEEEPIIPLETRDRGKGILGDEMETNHVGVIVDTENINDSSGAEGEPLPTMDSKSQKIQASSEGFALGAVLDSSVDVEEGEIQFDTIDDFDSTELEPSSIFMQEEEKDTRNQDELGVTSVIPLEEPQQIETGKQELSSNDPFHRADDGSNAHIPTGAEEPNVDNTEAVHQESVPSQVITWQGQKNTTIVLAERARERALIRRSGISPPSPGSRGRSRALRGGKRSIGVQRERVILSDTQMPGAEVEEGKISQTTARVSSARHSGSQSTSASNKLDAGRDEQD